MVYLIENLNSSTYKIGYSQNPNKRLQSLQTSTSDTLILVSTMEGDLSVEKLLHKKFKQFHLIREWFKKDEMILKEFNKSIEFSNIELEEDKVFVNFNYFLNPSLSMSDIQMAVYLIKEYNQGCEFCITDNIKTNLSIKTNKNKSAFNKSANALIKAEIILRLGKKSYKINPKFVFKTN